MNSAETLAWFKSSYSGGDGGDCIEVATRAGAVHVRDSKDVARPALTLSRDAWAGFVGLASAE
ncbi:DUF397 domain-containing protein [Streptomyces sp. NPDC005389]|uniref:DUF397 domain-containing protein n=1 Tax=Streptomyces sp. NPDC005389 TaxID=3157040 RepID=UPI0033A67F98